MSGPPDQQRGAGSEFQTIIPCAKAVTAETWEPSPEGRDGETTDGERGISQSNGESDFRTNGNEEKTDGGEGDGGIEWQGKTWWWREGLEQQLLTFLCPSAWGELGWWCTFRACFLFSPLTPHASCSYLTSSPLPVFALSLFHFPPLLCHRVYGLLGKMTSH